ncbi:MAG: fatty acid desaturase, partial [Sphingorhabdus sp.]|nr:fatty acid desaturase [Sphingorhabdus sp.]
APAARRYQALPHLVPGVPYHARPEVHRRLAAKFGSGSNYGKANYPNLRGLLARLVKSSVSGGKAA